MRLVLVRPRLVAEALEHGGGHERARRAGTQLGRPSVLNRQTRIQRLQRSGHTVREIAEKVDLSVGTVHKALRL